MTETIRCLADCFRDGKVIRPIKDPTKLTWLYFNVYRKPKGTLEARQFTLCHCPCGNLVANPPVKKNTAPSNVSVPIAISTNAPITISTDAWDAITKSTRDAFLYRFTIDRLAFLTAAIMLIVLMIFSIFFPALAKQFLFWD